MLSRKIDQLLAKLGIAGAVLVQKVSPVVEAGRRTGRAVVGPVMELSPETGEWMETDRGCMPQSNRTHRLVRKNVGRHIVLAYIDGEWEAQLEDFQQAASVRKR